MITEKNAQMLRKRKACRYVRNTRKGLRRLSELTKKTGYSEELPDDNADFTDRGAPLWQYDPKIMRARSRFEGVSPAVDAKYRMAEVYRKGDARFGAGLEGSFSSFGDTSLVVLTLRCHI